MLVHLQMYIFNMQTFYLFLGIYLLIFPPSSAVKIGSITEIPKEINILSGSRLLIQCHFNTDKSTHNRDLEIEWGKTPFEGGSFQSYVYIHDPEILEYKDSRAHVFLSHLMHGNCSLVIDPVLKKDEGYFELRLRVDGNSYEPFPFLAVRVSEPFGQKNETDLSDQNRGFFEIKEETINGFLAHPNKKKRPLLIWMMIHVGGFLALSIVGSLGVSAFLIRQRRKKRQNELKLAEEGYASADD